MNSVLVNFVLTLKKKDGNDLQPNSTLTCLKTLFSSFNREGITLKLLRDFKNFEGCLDGVLQEIWRRNALRDSRYGTKPTIAELTDKDVDLIRDYIASIDHLMWDQVGWENDIRELIFWALSTSFALRGRTEHYSLTWGQIRFGNYGSGCPVGMENIPFVEIVNLVDKTHKIDIGEFIFFVAILFGLFCYSLTYFFIIANPTIRSSHRTSKVALTDDPLNACNVLLKYRRCCHPEQKYLYCHNVKPSEDIENKAFGMNIILFAKDR